MKREQVEERKDLMKNPKVTIVIPVYNGERYIKESIDSALAQSYDNCEIIVVNDGSTDETETIVLSYGDKIRYFAKKNGGVSTALNMGIENMTGEYFQYLPCDDKLHPDKIKLQMQAVMDSGDDMSIVWSGLNYLFQESGKQKAVRIPVWYPRKQYEKGVFPLFFGILNTVTVLIPKKYFSLFGKFNVELYTSQDYDMWFRTFRAHDTIYIDKELVDYRIHEEQGSQADSEFMDNCMECAWNMLHSITASEIRNAFGSEYAFYYQTMEYYKRTGWFKCLEYVKDKFRFAEEPEDAEQRREGFRSWLNEMANDKEIVLFCAGRNGQRLLNELEWRGIEVSAFCDSDMSKQGKMISGKRCLAPEQLIRKECLIIVTKNEPEELRAELLQGGFRNVTTYEIIADKLYQTVPIKDRVLAEEN